MRVGRMEYYTKDGIYVSYTDRDVCFEDIQTAESILISNNGTVIRNNFAGDGEKTRLSLNWFRDIYPTVTLLRTLDRLENI